MEWEYAIYTVPLLLAAMGSAVLATSLWRRRRAPGATAAIVLMLAMLQWSLFYLLELGSSGLRAQLLWLKLEYPGIVTAPVAWMSFALGYTGHKKWLTRRNLALLAIIPAITLGLVWTNEWHHLYYADVSLSRSGPFEVLALTFGPWYWVHVAYSYLLILVGTGLLLGPLLGGEPTYRRQSAVLFLGALAPWAASAIYLLRLLPFPYLDLTPFAFTVAGLAMAWNISRFRLFDLVPVARETVVESMSTGVLVLDDQNRVVDLNPVAAKIVGATGSQAVGQPLEQVLARQPGLLEVFRGGEARVEFAVDEGDGKRHYELSLSPLLDRERRVAGRLAVFHDLTDRKQMEDALKESEERLRTLFEYAPDAYYLNDLQGNFLDGNRAAEEATGYRREELIGKNFLQAGLLSPAQVPKAAALLARNALGQATGPDEFLLRRKDGSQVTFEIRTYPVCFKGRDLVLGIARDVTEWKEAEARQKKLIEELQAALAQVQTLSGLLPICASCKKIRDDKGYWNEVELYIQEHSTAEFTHSLCPDCLKKLYPRLYGEDESDPVTPQK